MLEAFAHGKDVVLMNAELDATIGPILQVYADASTASILSACDGDEPGVQMNLVRWVKGLGPDAARGRATSRACRTRTATRRRRGLRGEVGPEPGDGDQLRRRLEDQLRAGDRGQRDRLQGAVTAGCRAASKYDGDVMKIGKLYDIDEVRARWAASSTTSSARRSSRSTAWPSTPTRSSSHYLSLYKMGDGPLYSFFIPYHLVHFEAPNAIARVVLFGDAVAPPLGGPVVEVCAVAKRDLKAGEDARRLRDVHDLRRGGQRRRDVRAALPARGSGRRAAS